jgi:methylenetetrahydrofolate dehydrogenase (NADP+)/methenyltetrahydrofolate cyclohydrolase
VIKKIHELNVDKSVHAILVQVPVPAHINPLVLQEEISPLKDADGFGPYNMGRLFMGNPALVAATPAGVMRLLCDYKLSVAGKKCTVVGRSNIVGKPLALLLIAQDATVTMAHSKTGDLEGACKGADFLFVAAGKAGLIKKQMVKNGAVVVDVGINRCDEKECKPEKEENAQKAPEGAHSRLVGDVDFEKVKDSCSYITPVPGGVGPMTIASLIANTLQAYKMQGGK